MTDQENAIQSAAESMGLVLQDATTSIDMQRLKEAIDELLAKQFDRLISILYRLDVSETKLRALLHDESGRDAATIVAELIVERQLQRIRSRSEYRASGDAIDENEKW